MKHPKLATSLLAASLFGSGASGLIFEYILATTSSHILGNSIYQFSLIVGIMMLSMGAAVFLQKFISDRNLLHKFCFIELTIALLGGLSPVVLHGAYSTIPEHFVFVQYLSAASMGLLVGFEIPLVLRISKKYNPELKDNIANTFSWDYVGAFLGTIVWLSLLSKVPLHQIAVITAATNLSIAALTCIIIGQKKIAYAISVSSVFGFLAVTFFNSGEWIVKLEAKLYNDPVQFVATTKYQHIVLTHNPKIDDWRVYINGNLQLSSIDEHIYHEGLVHPVMSLSEAPKRVLVLGGGDGMAVREIVKYPSVENVTLVDLDPQMTTIAREALAELNGGSLLDAKVNVKDAFAEPDGIKRDLYEVVEKNGKLESVYYQTVDVMNLDAAKFIEFTDEPWDVVIIDFPDPNSVELAKLYSREFYVRLLENTTPDTVVAVQATSPYHARQAYLCIGKTMMAAGWEVMPYQDNVPSFGQWGWYLAWKPEKFTKRQVIDQFLQTEEFAVDTTYLTPDKFLSNTVFGKDTFIDMDTIAINTTSEPKLLNHYLKDGWKIE